MLSSYYLFPFVADMETEIIFTNILYPGMQCTFQRRLEPIIKLYQDQDQ